MPPDISNLSSLSVDELINVMKQRAQEVQQMIANPDTAPGGPEAEMPMVTSADAPAPSKVMPAGKGMTGMPAELVRDATAALVDSGLLPKVQGQLDTNLMDLLSAIAEATAPGLYDLTDEQQVEELLRGLSDGTIAIPPADQLNAGAGEQPVPDGGAGLPGAQLPGGGAGAGGPGFNPDQLL
jgi:hypothetical protein